MVIGDGQSNGVIQIDPALLLVAMATKFETKWAITWLLLERCFSTFLLQRNPTQT